MLKIDQASVVLVANSYNLSILNQLWLVDNDIVSKSEIDESEAFHSPVAINIANSNYELLLLQDRAQLVLHNVKDDNADLIKRIFSNLVKALPHTPYISIGYNFRWSIHYHDNDVLLKKVKELYLTNTNPIKKFFESEDSRFGIYLSTESLHHTRLRLDIKPSVIDGYDKQVLDFNYNLDLNGNLSLIHPLVEKWIDFKTNSNEVSEEINNYIEN